MPGEYIHEEAIDLKDFETINVLGNNSKSKTIFVLGRFRSRPSDDAILILEKIAFDTADLEGPKQKLLFEANNQLEKIISNDIYGNYSLKTDSDFNSNFRPMVRSAFGNRNGIMTFHHFFV